jgi:hypothetical protein
VTLLLLGPTDDPRIIIGIARGCTLDDHYRFGSTGISQYPYCMQGEDNPGWSGCSYNTMQACQAAASGTEAGCLANPWYQAGGSEAQQPRESPIGANGPLLVGPPPNQDVRAAR